MAASYGWLRMHPKHSYGWLGGKSPIAGGYVPANGTVWDFLLEESSGNITDSASSIELTATGTATYDVETAQSGFTEFNPGITVGSGIYFSTTSSTTGPGTGDWNFEWISEQSSLTGNQVVIGANQTGSSFDGTLLTHQSTGGAINVYIQADNGQAVSFSPTGTVSVNTVYGWQVLGDRDGGSTGVDVLQDGSSIGTSSISVLVGDNVPHPVFYFGNSESLNRQFLGTIYRARFSTDLTNAFI